MTTMTTINIFKQADAAYLEYVKESGNDPESMFPTPDTKIKNFLWEIKIANYGGRLHCIGARRRGRGSFVDMSEAAPEAIASLPPMGDEWCLTGITEAKLEKLFGTLDKSHSDIRIQFEVNEVSQPWDADRRSGWLKRVAAQELALLAECA